MGNDTSDLAASNHHGLRETMQRFVNANGEDAIPSQINYLENVLASLKQRVTGAALVIAGVELTQATQYFSINGQGSDYAADNSVPLIAQRELMLRIYVNDRGVALLPKYVTGRVTVYRVNNYGPDQHIATLSPTNGPLRAKSSAAIDRGDSDQTLNFRLRAAKCQGTLRFHVSIKEQPPLFDNPLAMEAEPLSSVNSSPIGSMAFTLLQPENEAPDLVASPEGPSSTAIVHGRFESVPTFRVRAVLVHYTGGGQDIPAPSGLDFAKTFEYVLKTYPIGRLEFSDCVEIDYDGDLSVPGGGCGPGWEGLLGVLREVAAGSDDNDIYVGLLPNGVMSNNGIIGCGNTGVAASINGNGPAMAQEIGHALSRQHAPCGGADGVDQNYPTYNGYLSGSIGEYGFDVFGSRVFNPARTYDFMGYCPSTWVSPHTYIGLRNAIQARFSQFAMASLVNDARQETLFLNFRVDRDGTVEMLPSFHLLSVPQPTYGDLPSEIACELLDETGRVLCFHRCRLTEKTQDEYGPHVNYQEVIPWAKRAVQIRFLRNREVLHVHDIEKTEPSIKIRTAKIRYAEKGTKLAWSAMSDDSQQTYFVRYSNDDGAAWHVIGANLRKTEFHAKLGALPGGERCMFQIVAISGVRTSVAETEPFSSPLKPRAAAILSPPSNTEVPESETVILRGGAFSPDFGLGDLEDVLWTSNLDGPLGEGIVLVVENLSIGFHTITLTVPDGIGGTSQATVSVRIIGSDNEPKPT